MAKPTIGAGAVVLAAALALMGCASTISGDGQALLPSTAGAPSTPPAESGPPVVSTGPAAPTASTAPTAPTGPSEPSATTPMVLPSAIAPAPKGVAIIESHRLGAVAVDPTAIDHAAVTGCVPAGPVPTPGAANIVFADGAEVMRRTGYVGGWFNCFHLGQPSSSAPSAVIGVMEFVSAEGAQAAATLILRGDDDSTPTTLAGAPGAQAVTRTIDNDVVVEALVLRGSLASYVYASALSAAVAQSLAARSLSAQSAAAKAFTPTPPAKWGALNDDPGNLAGKIVQPAGNPSWYAGGYDLASYRAIAESPQQEVPKLKGLGFSEYYLRDGSSDDGYAGVALYLLKDANTAKAAETLLGGLLKQEDPKAKVITPKIADIPAKTKGEKPKPVTATCVEYSMSAQSIEQHCVIMAGRHVVEVTVDGYPKKAGDMEYLQKVIGQQLALTPAT